MILSRGCVSAGGLTNVTNDDNTSAMSRKEPVRTIDELIEALGGTVAVAEWAQVRHTAVSNWRTSGFIPPGWHLLLLAECSRREITVDLNGVFGLAPSDVKALQGRLPAVL